MRTHLQPAKYADSCCEHDSNTGLSTEALCARVSETEEIILSWGTREAPVTMTLEEVRVDMAQMKAECRPVELVTSVGSCVAICVHDLANRCGGLAHIMLPDSGIAPEEYLPFKFADTAVPALKKVVRKLGAYDSRLTAKIVGGANMFANLRTTLNIGVQNIEAARQHLTTNNIGLIAEDVGGNRGRRVAFNVVTGLVTVRTIDGEIKKI